MNILSKDLVVGNRYSMSGIFPQMTGILIEKSDRRIGFMPDNVKLVEDLGYTIHTNGLVYFSGLVQDAMDGGFAEIITN